MGILEAKNISYSYDGKNMALSKVCVNIEKGKVTAFLGGNGSGKSTLFLNLNGVLRPSEGECYIKGEKIEYNKAGLKKLRNFVGIVFQDPNDQLFSSNVRNDIGFGLMSQGLDKKLVNQKVEEVAKKLDIYHLLDRPVHELSYGQKKRVAIAGVLIMEPEVIILDEPTAGLDPQGVSEILRLFESIRRESNTSILISTHDIDLVPLYCDDVYLMDKGKVAFSGSVEEFFENPSIIRSHHLRMPRLAHLMEILSNEDKLSVDKKAYTISKARASILELVKNNECL